MLQEILSNEEVAGGIFRMAISSWPEVQDAHAGQFIHIRCSSLYDPLLRRPFSIHERNQDSLVILYRVVGKGTDLLSKRKPGEKIDVIGPLGCGFKAEPSAESALIVAGGMGVAPLLFLAQTIRNEIVVAELARLKKSKASFATTGETIRAEQVLPVQRGAEHIKVLLGARTRGLVLCEEKFKKLDCSVEITTDDGSYGEKGYVSLLFKKVFEEAKPSKVYACGPWEMLREIAGMSRNCGVRCQVSIESQMGCGVGACLGCVIETKRPDGSICYRRVCKEGPVFDAKTVVWEDCRGDIYDAR